MVKEVMSCTCECVVVIRFNGYEGWEPVGMKDVGCSGGMNGDGHGGYEA